MGVLAPRFAHARPSAQPYIDVSGNFSAHMSAESPLNISPNPSEVISKVSEPYDNFSKYPPVPVRGGMGGARIIFYDWNPNISVSLEPMQNFETLRRPKIILVRAECVRWPWLHAET